MNRVASARRTVYGGILLSLVLLWCTALGLLPARAAAEPSVQPLSSCNSASVGADCPSVCNAPLQAAADEQAPPSGGLVIAPAVPLAPLVRIDVATPLHLARAPLAGPPLYLRLHRLLN